ncbi:MAG: NAD-dependent dehydratase [Chlamydiae bacterium CG10_big_fil_rev_8_21_14_0_10_35_9]|nr:MAG: NAD-dependent dehydratase [Chlamydiae bacterium CG10_big_fil_rev_8_21_14_0_10_35_9]
MNSLNHLLNQEKKPNRIVILGANGFIGKTLYCLLKQENLEVLPLGRQELDLTNESSSDKLVSLLKETDSVVFLSTITPDKGNNNETFVQNMLMAKNVCYALEKVKVSHLIYLSSDTVYPLNHGIISETSPAHPENLFGAMHLSREYMLKGLTSVPLAILRSTLVYGFEDTHNSYGPNRLRRMAFNEGKISLFGQGEENRDHIFIDDLIKIIRHVLFHKSTGVLNLVTGQSISYMELAKKIASFFDSPIEISCSERKNPITHRHFDSSSIFKAFPTFKFTSLDEGLKSTYEKELNSRCTLSCP